jgi:hypothetical protein
MAGPPPFGDGRLATLENWLLPPFNRWAFQHVRALNRGNAAGRQVIAPEWLDDTIKGAPDGPLTFRQGDGAGPGNPDGAHYRNYWWVTGPGVPVYHASGIYGQFVFVHVPSQVVVAKLSSWPAALSPPMSRATIAAVTAVASALGDG